MFKPRDARRAPTFDDEPEYAAMLHAATDLDRDTYTHAGFQPVECRHCGTCVSVRKNSEKHTSVQWTGNSSGECFVFQEWSAGAEKPKNEDTCPRLQASIKYAYAEGFLTVTEGVDPDADQMVNPSVPLEGR